MGTTRVARTAAATLSHTFYVGETPTDPTGTPTCTITDANGTSVQSGNATIVGGGSGRVTFALTPLAQLAALDATWTATVGGVSITEVDQVEIVGGFLFSLAEGRASDSTLADTTKYPLSELIEKRQQTEEELELICDQAFVPRYRRVVTDGTGTSDLPVPDGPDEVRGGILLRGVRTIRRASIAPRVGQAFVDLTAAQLAAVTVAADGSLRRTDGNVWTEGDRNVIVEYEFGNDASPADLKQASLLRFRDRLNIKKRSVPDRAVSFTVDDRTYRIALPEAYRTGIPDVDAVYERYSRRVGSGADGAQTSQASSRTLSYDPSTFSLFHNERR